MKRIIFFLIFISGLFAQDQTLTIQGVLRQPSGKAVADGTYDITFNFYNAESGGSAIASKLQSVEVKDGLYTANIDISGIPFDEQYWIGIQIGSDNELTPRAKLTAAPYALALKGLDNELPSTGTVVAGDSLRVGGSVKISGSLESDGTLQVKSPVNVSDSLKINNLETLNREANGDLQINSDPGNSAVIMKGSRLDLYVDELKMTQTDGSGAKRVFVPDTTNDQLIMNYANDFGKVNIQSETEVKSLSFSQGGGSPMRIIRGLVYWDSDNNVLVLDSEGNNAVTLETPYQGYYNNVRIVYNTPFQNPPTVLLTPYIGGSHFLMCRIYYQSSTEFNVYRKVYNNSFTELPDDTKQLGFMFVVIGY